MRLCLVLTFAIYWLIPSSALGSGFEMDWMIGQVVTSQKEIRRGLQHVRFHSTGFLVRIGDTSYFITALHTLRGIHKGHGKDEPIYALLPNLRTGVNYVYRLHLLFVVEEEDAAAFAVPDLMVAGDYQTEVRSIRVLRKNDEVTIVGYRSDNSYGPPEIVRNTFISCATVKNGLSYLGCDYDGNLLVEFYTSGPISSEGLSGSPVFEASSGALVGLVKGYGDDAKDPRVAVALGVRRFNIVRPIEHTVSRLRESVGKE